MSRWAVSCPLAALANELRGGEVMEADAILSGMARALYFYLHSSVPELEIKVSAFQEDFDEFLKELYSDEELESFGAQLDSMAAVYVQPVFEELCFDDFFTSQKKARDQEIFFGKCKSSICFENIPEFFENPFQVTYIFRLLNILEEVLVDQGGSDILMFKEDFLEELKSYKCVDSLISSPMERPVQMRSSAPVFPIDFLVLDVYQEIERLRGHNKIYQAMEEVGTLPEKYQRIFHVMLKEKSGPDILLKSTALGPKDLDDSLERLKFFLRRI